MYTAAMLFLALFLVFLNGFFVAAEFSFVKVRKTQLELLAASGDSRAKSALFGVTHLDAYLSVCQLGITLASLGLGWLGEPAVASLLRPALTFFAMDNPALVSSLSFAVGFSIITLMHVVFGELAPKSVAIQKAEAAVLLLARPMRFFYVICLPLVAVMNGISNAVLRLAGMRPASENAESHSAEELRMLILDSSQRGALHRDEGRMLDNIFSFYHKTAKDIMIHRMDVLAFDANTPVEDILGPAHESGHTRFPVFEENRDNIIGFLHLKDVGRSRGNKNLRRILRKPFYAHETLHLDKMLQSMRENRQQFSVVLDEYGVWQGIVTMEDIVEAIVGDIQDEFDNEEQDVIAEAEGLWSASADMSLDELAEYMPLDCAGNDVNHYKIVAAHFMERLEHIPREGDFIDLCGKRFTISRMEGKRIRRVRVEDAPRKGAEA